MKDVVVKELEDKRQDGHRDDYPHKVMCVVLEETLSDNLGREAVTKQESELGEVENVEGRLADEGGDVKAGRLKEYSETSVTCYL